MASSSNHSTIFEAIVLYAAEAPTYHIILEVVLALWIIKLLFFTQQYHPDRKDAPTKEEEEELINDWTPCPLVPPTNLPKDRPLEDNPVVSGIAGPHMTVNGKNCLNLATYNFLGLLGDKSIHDVAAKTVRKYGVGSCGPRGFYGTMDVHLNLEERIAKFCGREEAIVYSYGFAAIASSIPAYSKRTDIIFCDDQVCFPIQKGLVASRSTIKFFRHNDMDHLQELIEEQRRKDKKNPSKANKIRNFIIAEGLYMNSGDLAPLPKLVEFRNRYRIPIILEESLSFGVLGKTGRGAVEHFGLSVDDVDIICVSMSMSIANMGGFCAGKSFIIDHQRLSGLGYCFSASQPPLQAAAAIKSLDIMDDDPSMFEKVRKNAYEMRRQLKSISGLEVCGNDSCPVIHLRVAPPSDSREKDQAALNAIVAYCLDRGVALTTAKYLEREEHKLPLPSIRLTVCSMHTTDELTNAVSIIKDAAEKQFS